MSDDKTPTSDSAPDTAAQATRAARKALDDAQVGSGDYEVRSHKIDDGVETTVTVSGWSHPGLVSLIADALKAVEGSPKIKRDGRTFILTFS